MPREATKPKVMWTCKCNTRQVMPQAAWKTVKCVDPKCATEYALVRDPDSPEAPAMVELFNQGQAPNRRKKAEETA